MDHKEGDFRKICFHCASIYETEDGEILMCPVCGKSILASEYERVMQGVRQAVLEDGHVGKGMRKQMIKRRMRLWKRYLWIMFLIS